VTNAKRRWRGRSASGRIYAINGSLNGSSCEAPQMSVRPSATLKDLRKGNCRERSGRGKMLILSTDSYFPPVD